MVRSAGEVAGNHSIPGSRRGRGGKGGSKSAPPDDLARLLERPTSSAPSYPALDKGKVASGRKTQSAKANCKRQGGKPSRRRKVGLFLSYAHEDAAHARAVEKALSVLVGKGEIEVYADWRMNSGEIWRKKLKTFVRKCRIAIPLLSSDFFSSAFISEEELPTIVRQAGKDRMTILPLLVRDCAFELHDELGRLQLVNSPEKPLACLSVSQVEAELTKLTRQVGQVAAAGDRRKR